MTAQVPTVTLNDGTKLPKIGYGIGTAHYGSPCTQHVLSALQTGYNYIDCAQMYANSKSLGDALAQWDGKREDVFVVQKCGQNGTESHPRDVLKALLKETNLDYVDLYLLHSPLLFKPLSLSAAWKVMEDLKAEGLAKSIGVSNFREEDLLEIKKTWTVVPSVNQIEYHPYIWHTPNVQRLVKLCNEEGVKLECYGPLSPLTKAPGGPVDPVVKRIAKERGAEASQVLLAWAAQKSGGAVVTTSANKDRQKIQLQAITQFTPLTADEVNEISEAGKGKTLRGYMQAVWDGAKP